MIFSALICEAETPGFLGSRHKPRRPPGRKTREKLLRFWYQPTPVSAPGGADQSFHARNGAGQTLENRGGNQEMTDRDLADLGDLGDGRDGLISQAMACMTFKI